MIQYLTGVGLLGLAFLIASICTVYSQYEITYNRFTQFLSRLFWDLLFYITILLFALSLVLMLGLLN